jgi:amicyanin
MKNKLIVILLVAIVFLSGCMAEQMVQETPEPTVQEQVQETQPTASETHNINIENFAFGPKELTINKGDTVVWENLDSTRHTVTSDTGTELGSELLAKNDKYSHTFSEAGTFEYHCTPHPFMKAKIIVQ